MQAANSAKNIFVVEGSVVPVSSHPTRRCMRYESAISWKACREAYVQRIEIALQLELPIPKIDLLLDFLLCHDTWHWRIKVEEGAFPRLGFGVRHVALSVVEVVSEVATTHVELSIEG